jgi:hypothetical protein
MPSRERIISAVVSAMALVAAGFAGQTPASATSVPRLYNYSTNLCAAPYGGGTATGTIITQWECNGDASEVFEFKDDHGFTYYYNPHSKKCLSVDGVSDGANLILEPCLSWSEYQFWSEDSFTGQIETSNVAAYSKLITTKGGSTKWGAFLTLWSVNGSAAQNWGHR